MNGYAQARLAYTESSVLTATPEQLVVMLYDGAIGFLRQASAALRAGNRSVAANRLTRAEAIVNELNYSLDMSHGDIPERLRSIYLFVKRQLLAARLDGDAGLVDSVVPLLAELREAWDTLARSRPAA